MDFEKVLVRKIYLWHHWRKDMTVLASLQKKIFKHLDKDFHEDLKIIIC